MDTEFSDRGPEFPVELISIALVSQDNRELYLVSPDNEFSSSNCNEFVKKNVLPKITKEPRTSRKDMSQQIQEFVGINTKAMFVGYFGVTDFLLLRHLFWPNGFPKLWKKWYTELVQMREPIGYVRLPKKPQVADRHNALVDAQWTKNAFDFLENIRRSNANSRREEEDRTRLKESQQDEPK